jgi:hypothetical protein
MKRIFRIKFDVGRFDSLKFESPTELDVRFENARLGPFGGLYTGCLDWPASVEPLVCLWEFDDKPKPTFPFLANGAIAMSEDTYWECENIFPQACEFFYIQVDGESWVAVNVIDICNGLDLTLAKIRKVDGEVIVDEYAIRGDRANENVFKIPETASKEVFTSTGRFDDADQEFARFYEENSWTGLTFDEVKVT